MEGKFFDPSHTINVSFIIFYTIGNNKIPCRLCKNTPIINMISIGARSDNYN